MALWTDRVLALLCFVLLSTQYGAVSAFQAKSLEAQATTASRPAFQMNNKQHHHPKQPADVHAAAPTTSAHFAFAPAMQGGNVYYEEEEEVEISVGTAIVACAVSLALGFGLGYGT